MLNVENIFLNTEVFLVLMHTIDLLWLEVFTRFGFWVTVPNIKDYRSLVLPEPTCMDV